MALLSMCVLVVTHAPAWSSCWVLQYVHVPTWLDLVGAFWSLSRHLASCMPGRS